MSDRLDHIAIFVAVAEHESFAEAARRLNRTPATVTRAVAALEEDLRLRLLNRTTRSVSLTDEGARYLEAARRVLSAYDDLKIVEAGDGARPHGSLSVTAPLMFGRLHVMPAIGRFLGQFPEIRVRALLLDRVVSLVDEGIDVAVRLGSLPDSSLRATRVGHIQSGIYAAPDYLARHGVPATPQDLGDHATISALPFSNSPDRWSFDGAGGYGQVAVKPRLIVNSAEAAAEAASEGIGITNLICYQAASLVREGRLKQILLDYVPPAIPINIVHPAGRFVPAKVRIFIDHLARDLRQTFDRPPEQVLACLGHPP